MGAGSYPAGFGMAGVDPAFMPPSPVTPTIAAIQFDPATRQHVQNADGTMAEAHPVDALVVNLLFYEQGSVKSAPTLGQRIRARCNRVDPAKVPAIVTEEVRAVLLPLIQAGDIDLISVDTDTSTPGRLLDAVTYRNLRAPGAPTLTARSNAQ